MRLWAVLVGLGAVTLGSGCIVRQHAYVPVVGTEEVVVEQQPPPVQTEVVTVAPSSGYIWVNGFWRWGPGRWVWVPGHWMAPRYGQSWVPGQWGRRGRVWVYRPGHWRRY